MTIICNGIHYVRFRLTTSLHGNQKYIQKYLKKNVPRQVQWHMPVILAHRGAGKGHILWVPCQLGYTG